jgi:hypothetical protein
MLAGIAMGLRQDFTLMSAHAHLNLVGGVLVFLFGLYYRRFPAAGTTWLAKLQGSLRIVETIVFPAGTAPVILEGPAFEATAIAGWLLVAATAPFTIIVFRTSQA